MAVTIKVCLMASAGGGGRVEGKFSLKKHTHNSDKHISGRTEEFKPCEACVSEEEARRGGSVLGSSGGAEGREE